MPALSHRHVDHYADGRHIAFRRRQKAAILVDTLQMLLPHRQEMELVDFGCADGAIPVLMLQSPLGAAIRRVTGITLLDYNDLAEKPAHAHARFQRVIADLSGPLDDHPLPWGACDAVLATAFLHYLADPSVAFRHAARLLQPGGYLLAGMPACWVLRLRRRGIPSLLPRNTRIATVCTLDAWRDMARASGFTEVGRQAIQWCGLPWTSRVETWLRRMQYASSLAANYLVIYRKDHAG
jgi:SAM-dependent methyltransferase